MKFLSILCTLLLPFLAIAKDKEFDGYIVKFKKGSHSNEVVKSFDNKSKIIKTSFGDFAKIDKKAFSKVSNKSFENYDDIEYIEPNWIVKAFDVNANSTYMPTDSDFSRQWSLYPPLPGKPSYGVSAVDAWAITKGSKEITIAVLDSGIDYNHPDLKNQIHINEKELIGLPGVDDDGNGFVDDVYGYNFVDNNNNPMDNNIHGTHCAGIIGAAHNGQGAAGIMPNVKLLAVKILDQNARGSVVGIVRGINYAIENNVQIMTNSYGMYGKVSQALRDAVEATNKKGILFVAGAGNDSLNNDTMEAYPANYPFPNIISVGSSNEFGLVSVFSNFGKKTVHLLAPGENIYSTVPNGQYKSLSGTSMSTPLVAGIAGLMLSYDSSLRPEEIKEILMASSTYKEKFEKDFAAGIVNAKAALDMIKKRGFSPRVKSLNTSQGQILLDYSFNTKDYKATDLILKSYVDGKHYSSQVIDLRTQTAGETLISGIDPVSFFLKEKILRFDIVQDNKTVATKTVQIPKQTIEYKALIKDISFNKESAKLSIALQKNEIFKLNNTRVEIQIGTESSYEESLNFEDETSLTLEKIINISKSQLLRDTGPLVTIKLKMDDTIIEIKSLKVGFDKELNFIFTAFSSEVDFGRVNSEITLDLPRELSDLNKVTIVVTDPQGKVLYNKTAFAFTRVLNVVTEDFAIDPYNIFASNINGQSFSIDYQFLIDGVQVAKTRKDLRESVQKWSTNMLAVYFDKVVTKTTPGLQNIEKIIELIVKANQNEMKVFVATKNESIYKENPWTTLPGYLARYKQTNKNPSVLNLYKRLGNRLLEQAGQLSTFKRSAYKNVVGDLL